MAAVLLTKRNLQDKPLISETYALFFTSFGKIGLMPTCSTELLTSNRTILRLVN